MDKFCYDIGLILCGLGGGMLMLILSGLAGWFACWVWVQTFSRLRKILKTEALFLEYRRYRHEFLCWRYGSGRDML